MSNRFTLQTPVAFNKIVTYFTVSVVELILFESAKLKVSLYTQDDILYENKYYTLTNDEYILWNNNDQYVINYVNDHLATDT